MRKVTIETAKAFLAGTKRTVGNTATDGTTLTLHGNVIARKESDGRIVATLAGWPTVTTRERLNGLCELMGLGRPFHQKRRAQFFGLSEICSSDWLELK